MAASDLASKTIHELQGLLASGQVSPNEVLEDLLSRIDRVNPSLHAYLAIEPERLRRQLHAQRKGPGQGLLWGLPMTIKNNICIEGEETTCASRILQGFR